MSVTMLALVLAGGVALADDKDEASSDQPVRIEDRLTEADARDRVRTGSAHKVHMLRLKGGQSYQIDLMRKDGQQRFDPYLRIEDMATKELASDDDSGGNLNARIQFTPAKDANYRIIATCLAGVGEYVLKVTPVALGKVEIVGDGGLAINGQLKKDAGAAVYRVKLSAGKAYVIDMESKKFDTFLVLSDSNGQKLATDDDGGEGTNARIEYTPVKEGVYHIEARALGAATGDYILKVRLDSDAAKAVVFVSKVYELPKDGLRIDDKLTNKDGKDNVRPAHAKVYQVQLTKGKRYTIDMMSNAMDSFLRLEDNGGKQLLQDDDSGEGSNARIRFQPGEDGVYRVIATSFGRRTGPFTVTVQEDE